MEIDEIVNNILLIPSAFHKGDVSFFSLLEKSGYIENHNRISENVLAEALSNNPTYITDWIQWSEDNRGTPSWFIYKNDAGKYVVGLSENGKHTSVIEYTDAALACANYIKNNIEETRPHIEASRRRGESDEIMVF